MENVENSIRKAEILEHIPGSHSIFGLVQTLERYTLYPDKTGDTPYHVLNIRAFIYDTTLLRQPLSFVDMDSYCILYTKEGECELNYDGFSYLLIPGSIAFTGIHSSFTLNPSKEKPWKANLLFLDGTCLAHYYEVFYTRGIAAFPICASSAIPGYIDTLRTTMELPWTEDYSEFSISKHLSNVLFSILLEKDTDPVTKSRLPSHVTAAIRYINQHFCQPITLDALAEELRVSKSTLSHDFARYIGDTPINVIIHKRIEYAKQQLVTTDKSISLIGNEAGFASDAYFVKTFKKRTGVSPLRFRKEQTSL